VNEAASAKSSVPAPLRYLLFVPVPWVFILGYLLGGGLQSVRRIHPAVHVSPHVTLAIGATIFLIGAAIAAWGWTTFLKARTTTVPGEASARLVTWGPYRFTRNPMYVGLTVAYVGEAVILRQIWPLVFLPLVVAYVNWVVIPVEQAKLTEVFGEHYTRYRAQVRRWL
jgi:protein-S-isoprenylcysteine O-methyltransferase Ste14